MNTVRVSEVLYLTIHQISEKTGPNGTPVIPRTKRSLAVGPDGTPVIPRTKRPLPVGGRHGGGHPRTGGPVALLDDPWSMGGDTVAGPPRAVASPIVRRVRPNVLQAFPSQQTRVAKPKGSRARRLTRARPQTGADNSDSDDVRHFLPSFLPPLNILNAFHSVTQASAAAIPSPNKEKEGRFTRRQRGE